MPNWIQTDWRECARGYSIALFKGSDKHSNNNFKIVLLLDKIAYWQYTGLNEADAKSAMDDLELAPGPRGDSSWLSVLARCMLKDKTAAIPATPAISVRPERSDIGTWDWVQSLSDIKLNR